jgi:hypothetical protein
MVQVFLHKPAHARHIASMAAEFDEDASRRGTKSLGVRLPLHSNVVVDLIIPGLDVDASVQHLVWNGAPQAVQFGVSAPADFPTDSANGTVTVSHAGLPIGCLKFKLRVLPAADTALPEAPQEIDAQPTNYKMAFISYASPDRDKVLARVQVLKALGIGFFQDVVDLSPGERWEKELYRHLDHADLVLLFWSTASKQSEWVRKEVQYAVARQHKDQSGRPHIRPILIEGPPVPPPWDDLAYLHFNDALLYLMSPSHAPDKLEPR